MQQEWTDEELFDAVSAYIDMLKKQKYNLKFVKSNYYKYLSIKHNRTPNSFKRRMHNISYVFSLMGEDNIDGLVPACNIGKKNFQKIAIMASQLLVKPLPSNLEFEYDVRQELINKTQVCPPGNIQPQSTQHTTTIYCRDPKVKAWVLKRANGICELCKQPAPFICADGLPYLEVHHIRPLAEGGPDTPSNTVAICPNCHRELHFGSQRKIKEALLYNTILDLSKA